MFKIKQCDQCSEEKVFNFLKKIPQFVRPGPVDQIQRTELMENQGLILPTKKNQKNFQNSDPIFYFWKILSYQKLLDLIFRNLAS